jgi:hypothetical protein
MTATSSDQLAAAAAADFAQRFTPYWQSALGTEFLGAYLIGSMAHGGFSRRYSDIDFAVVSEAGLTPLQLDQARSAAVTLSAEWGPRVSVFWTDRQFGIGRFPPLDRLDYLDGPVVLAERERVRPARPTLQEIRHYLCGAPFAGWADRAQQFAAAAALDPRDHKAYLRTLLYPARFCYGYLAGRMGSNDDAVAFLGEARPAGLDLTSVERALQCRHAGANPDSLFPLRTILTAQVDACAALYAHESIMLPPPP